MTDDFSRRTLFSAAAGAALVIGSSTSPAALAQTAPAAATGSGASLDEIIKRGTIRVGVAPNEPWAFKDPATSQWSGLSIALGQAIAEALKVKLEIEEFAFAGLVAALQAGRVDFAPMLDATPARALAVDFTLTPMVFQAQSVLVEDATKVKTWKDLDRADFTMAVPQGTVMESNTKKFAPKAQVLAFPSNAEAVAAFQAKRATGVSLFGAALAVQQARVKRGKIVILSPRSVAASNVAVRRTADKSFRDWMDLSVAYFSHSNRMQGWYEDFLRTRGIDPATVPAIMREMWSDDVTT